MEGRANVNGDGGARSRQRRKEMQLRAFVAPYAVPGCAHRVSLRCAQGEGGGLSDVDRGYIAKVRQRLLHTGKERRGAAGRERGEDAGGAQQGDAGNAEMMPDDPDEMDDIMFDRGPLNVGQVPLFGAWLDEAVAGRKAGKVRGEGARELDEGENSRVAADYFEQGTALFNRGRYARAARFFAAAVAVVGLESRAGGQYQLWFAQALDAAGEKAKAANILDHLGSHEDSDVRKVATEIRYILTAPALELDKSNFLEIPGFEDDFSATSRFVTPTRNFAREPAAMVKRKPEPYSIEWYLEKERPPHPAETTRQELLLLAGTVGVTVAFLFAGTH